MSPSPTAYGLAARLAAGRGVVRRPWRTLLVALLVALPVAGMTVAVVLFRTNALTADEKWELYAGQADATMQVAIGPSDTVPRPAGEGEAGVGADEVAEPAPLPNGSTVLDERTAYSRVLRTTDGARARARLLDLDINEPLAQGIVQLSSGRAPEAAGEVALSPTVADDLGVGVGDELVLDRPSATAVQVVGIVQLTAYLDEGLALVAPDESLLGAESDGMRRLIEVPAESMDGWLLDVGASMQDGGPWYEIAPDLRDRLSIASFYTDDGDNTAAVRWSWIIGGVVLTVVGIVIASAFAAGARRQLTTLGQLAANGAGPNVLKRVLFLQGTWTGVVGALLGLAVGAGVLAVGHQYVDDLFDRDIGGYDVRATDLVPVALIGIAAATIAALVPARTTSRIPVLAALAGRRPLTNVPRWVTVSGVVAIAGGLALFGLAIMGGTGGQGGNTDANIWAFTAIAGGMAVLLGACAIAPAYVSVLDGVSHRLTGPWRFAARSLARQRTRTGAVVSGVCAAGALAIGASALVLGIDAADAAERRGERYDEVHLSATTYIEPANQAEPGRIELTDVPQTLVDDMVRAVPTMERIDLTSALVSEDAWIVPTIADAAALDVYGLNAEDRAALARHGALTFVWNEDDIPAGETTDMPTSPDDGTLTAGVAAMRDYSIGMMSSLLVTPELAAEQGWPTGPGPVVLRNDDDLTRDELTAIEDIRDDYYLETEPTAPGPGTSYLNLGIGTYSPPGGPDPAVLEALLSGVALVFALFVVAVSLALASAETRDERDVLAVVGASPATTRRTSAHKALILTVMGALLAIPVGFLPVVVFTRADASNDPLLVFPWRTTALLVVAVPVITGLATMVASTVALWTRPVRVSTMTFD